MALARWQATIVDEAGNIQDGATVTVRREVAGSPLASIYSDRDGLTPLGNPVTADSEGFAAFHVPGGAYRITATKGAFSRVWRYVGIGLASEQDSPPVGVSWRFDDATADADPGAGLFRLNNANPASATEIYIDAQDADEIDQGAWLATLDDGGDASGRGTLVLRSVDNSALLVATVTGSITANGSPVGYYTIPVTILTASAAGTFIAGSVVGLIFTRAGTDGADGEVSGPGAVTSAGQFAMFADASGNSIEGGDLGDSPATPLQLASDANIRASEPGKVLHTGQLATAAATVALSDAATVAIVWTAGINFTLTLTANRTLGNPSAEIPGTYRTVLVQSDATSPASAHTLSFGNEYGGDIPTLDDITDTKKYLLTIYCKSAGQFLVTAIDGSDA